MEALEGCSGPTGSTNMAETCAMNFATMVSYSTSIALGGLSATASKF